MDVAGKAVMWVRPKGLKIVLLKLWKKWRYLWGACCANLGRHWPFSLAPAALLLPAPGLACSELFQGSLHISTLGMYLIRLSCTEGTSDLQQQNSKAGRGFSDRIAVSCYWSPARKQALHTWSYRPRPFLNLLPLPGTERFGNLCVLGMKQVIVF